MLRKTWILALNEIRRFRGGWLPKAVLIGIVLLPLLYGGLYLWTNWDPYGQADKIPVAVVNEDRGVERDGEKLNAGELFVDQLKHKKLFDWQFVSKNRADEGLRDGEYYFTVFVPEDFSKQLTSPLEERPEHASVTITLNDANNFIVGVVAEAARSQLQDQINTAVYSAYVTRILGDLTNLNTTVTDAASAAQQLNTGASSLSTGLGQMKTESETLATGAKKVSDGLSTLRTDLKTADDAASQQLPDAADTLVKAATSAESVTKTLATDASNISTAANDVVSKLQQFATDHPDIAQDADYKAIQTAAGKIATDASSTASAATNAQQSATSAKKTAQDFQSQVPSITSHLNSAATASQQLTDGANSVTSGSQTLRDGIATASQSSGQISTGAGQLTGGLSTAADRIPTMDDKQRAEAADVLGHPVQMEKQNLNPVKTYGAGMAPFFFSIALWVFAFAAYVFMRPISQFAIVRNMGSFATAIGAWLPVAALGSAGAVILYGVVQLGLGLDPKHAWGVVGISVLTVATFVAINQFLRAAFGVVGEALGLILLIVQLVSSGGLYPIETTPLPFQWIHEVIPMTYSVEALRIAIGGGEGDRLAVGLLVLAGYLVAGIAATIITARYRRAVSIGRLKPVVES